MSIIRQENYPYHHFVSCHHFVGIDVSKHTLDVCLLTEPEGPKGLKGLKGLKGPAAETHRCQVANDEDGFGEDGFGELLRWLDRHQARPDLTIVCMEHTGIYDDQLLAALTLAGYRCAVEKTTALQQVRPEHHRKSDAFDAALLAEYAWRFQDKLQLWSAPEPIIEEIRLLYRERRRLVTQRGAVRQLQGEAARRTAETGFAEALWQEQLALFQEQIKRLDEKLDRLVHADEDILRRYQIVRSVPGFGPVASLLFVMLFYGEGHLKARHIASRFGFAPHAAGSGTSRRAPARSSGHGMSEVRKVLTLCARSAGTHDAKMRAYKQKKLAEGKASQLVTNNMINKLLRVLAAVWNESVCYEAAHVSQFTQRAAPST